MATDTAYDGAEAAGGAGLPQLDPSTFANQIFWLIVALVAIYYILNNIVLPRIASVLAERNGTITNDIAAAEELKLRAAQAGKAYEKALADARAEAQKVAVETRAEIKLQLDEAIAKADAEISAKAAESEAHIAEIRASALTAVREIAGDTTGALVAALGGKVDEPALSAAVDAELKGRG
jgi:F-type H+-transporting ATPase subunit b